MDRLPFCSRMLAVDCRCDLRSILSSMLPRSPMPLSLMQEICWQDGPTTISRARDIGLLSQFPNREEKNARYIRQDTVLRTFATQTSRSISKHFQARMAETMERKNMKESTAAITWSRD